MQTIRVHTTQNVFIHYPLASVGDRIIGHLIDQIILIIYSAAVIAGLLKLDVEIWWVWLLALGFPWLFFTLAFEILMNGRSPGKVAMKMKVVRLDGTPPSLGDYLLRWLFRIIDFYVMSGALAMIIISAGKKGQRLGDIVAGTSVVKLVEQKEITAEDVFVVTQEDYTPVFSSVVQLSSKDIELVQQALEVNKNFGNQKPAELMSLKIKSVLNIQSDLPPVKFLYTIVKDFNHLAAQPL